MKNHSMQYLNFSFVLLASVGLIFLGACSNNNQTASTDKNSISISPTASASPTAKTNNKHGASKGGQVVETGAYHLEFAQRRQSRSSS
jgi:ABC-type enterochelin transport system substrate-binding protein